MTSGWDAAGKIEDAWKRVGGRDKLAGLTKIDPATLSQYNTGKRKLGLKNAQRIAAATGVSVLELGAPLGAADEQGQTLLDRLQQLADGLAESMEEQARLNRKIQSLQARIRKLEARGEPPATAATGPAG